MGTGERVDQIRGRDRRQVIETGDLLDNAVTSAKLNDDVYGNVAPSAIDPDDAGAAGTAGGRLSPVDHQHAAPAGTPSGLILTGTSAEGSGASFARNDHQHATDELPWGVVARQTITANNGGHSVDTATDFALNNVPVVAGRLYAIHMHTSTLFSSVDVTARWVLRLRLNGANFAVMEDLEPRVGGDSRRMSDATAYWVAPTTQATDDWDILADEIVNGAVLTLEGSATNPRFFTITDLGVL
jgi:hypothetical protein